MVQWSRRAAARLASIHHLMWNARCSRWTDLLLHNHLVEHSKFQCTQLCSVHACSWLPFLWGMPLPDKCAVDHVVAAMRTSGLVRAGGLATTAVTTGQQWDASCSWAPLVCTWVDGLCKYGSVEGVQLGHSLGETFLSAVWKGMSKTGSIWEKYSTDVCGGCGHGGEYEVQVGFGWTNGTVLHFVLNLGLSIHK